ncbi:MAG TPA: sulfatase [Solirubrobacterales bacterium]
MGALRYAGAGAMTVALVAIVAVGGATSPAAAGPNPPPPNVVVVMTDDQTQASLSKMATVESELAGNGATFTNNFTNWPLCCPSRSTFYTGQYAHNHGVLGNSPPDGGFTKFNDSSTLAVWLQAAGYHTVHIGKYLNGYGEGGTDPAYVPPGWNEWYAGTGGTTQTVYNYQLNQNGSLVDYGSAVADFKQDVFSNLAVDAINRNAPGGPFFLGVMYTAPHSGGPNPNPQPPSNCGATAKPAPRHATAFDSEPLPIPPNYNEADVSDKPVAIQSMAPITDAETTTIQRKYRCRIESLLSVDEGVGRIVDALDAAGELDNTLIVFTSDNGFFHGEHRVQSGKNRVYEEAVRVPLVIRGPGVPEGVTVDDLSVNADLAPTIVDAAAATAGLPEDGKSLLPFAEHPDRFHGRELLFEKGDVVDDVDDGTPQSGTFAAVRTSRYVYVDDTTGELELYDLKLDPYQLQNQITNPAYDAVEAALATRLASLRKCAGESCRTKPDLKLKLPRSHREHGRSCRDPKDFLARVRGSVAGQLVRATFAVGAEEAGHDTSGPFKKEIRPRLLREKRKPEVRVIAEMLDGRVLSLQKRVRICR